MNNSIITLICVLSILPLYAQKEAQGLFNITSSGAINKNRGELNKEFYEQTRTLLLGLSLGKKSSLQAGVSKSRVGNQEILEFPLLYRYQVTDAISVYGGFQTQLSRSLNTSEGALWSHFSPTIGLDVQVTPSWNGGIQFVTPRQNQNTIPKVNFENTPSLRLRTGVKW